MTYEGQGFKTIGDSLSQCDTSLRPEDLEIIKVVESKLGTFRKQHCMSHFTLYST